MQGLTPAGPQHAVPVDDALTWSTDDVPAGERLSYWVEAVCEAFFELRVDSEAGRAFEGSAHLRPLGPLGMIFMQLGHQHIERTPAQISRSNNGQFQLIQYRNLPGLVRQFGREAWVQPGGFTLVDSRYPFTIDNADGQDALSITLPVEWLHGWVARPEDAIAKAWTPGKGWAGTLSAFLATLQPDRNGGLALPGEVGSEQIGSLLALAIDQDVAPDDAGPPDRAAITKLRDVVRGSCHMASISPEEVAKYCGVSTRQLHHHFAAAGTSFAAEVVAGRLDGVKRMLADRRFATHDLEDVAARWGFLSARQLNHYFLRHYRVAPEAYRAAMQR